MPQHFYLDESGLDDQLMRLNRNLSEMLEFAYIHEDMVSTIEMFMVDWARIYLPDLCKELSLHDDLSISSIVDCSSEIDEQLKIKLIKRYRATVFVCLHSDTYDYDTIEERLKEIEED
jgi:hypothetical protein